MPNSNPPDSNVAAMLKRHTGCLPLLGIPIITIMASFKMFYLAEFLYINSAYGRAAWDAGLRVIDNKGHLSNGDSLDGWGHFFVYFGSYLMTVPFFAASVFGLTFARMKFYGEQLSEQLAKWKSENP
jgi:hypothetical protein